MYIISCLTCVMKFGFLKLLNPPSFHLLLSPNLSNMEGFNELQIMNCFEYIIWLSHRKKQIDERMDRQTDRRTNRDLNSQGYIFLYRFRERFCGLSASLHGSNNPFGMLYKTKVTNKI